MTATTAHGTPGEMDYDWAGFGNGGEFTVHQDVGFHALQPDGKVVLVGFSGVALSVTRRLANGDLDTGFGSGGTAIVTNLAYPARPRSVAVQADGKIVVAGYADVGTQDFMVARVTADGAADGTFSGDGFVTISFSTADDVAEKALIQPDGKIVVAGRSYLGGDNDWDFAVARFHPDGTLDDGFHDDGKATLNFGGDEMCWDAALQEDGKLVMVGGSVDGAFADGDFAIVRLNADGSVDGSFDDDGKVTTGFGDVEEARAVAIQPDLRIVVAGDAHMSRYHPNGSLDSSFDGDGKLSIGMNAYDVAITTEGKSVILGVAGGRAIFQMRTSTGFLDTGFSGDGSVDIGAASPAPSTEPPGLFLLADGRLLGVVPRGGACELARMWPNVSWDFGGRQTDALNDGIFPAGSQEVGHAMAIQADGKIVVAGQVSTAGFTETDFLVTRFRADGQLDTAFGTRGHATLSFHNTDVAKAMVIQPDGKIVVAGYQGTGTGTNFMVARFNSNGTVDDTFGFFGYNVINFFDSEDYGHAVALQADGKIVVAGPVKTGSEYLFGVARFTTEGFVDNTFSGDGKHAFNYFTASPTDWATAVVVQGSSRIIVGGFSNGDFALVGLTLSGTLDTSFGTSGSSLLNLGGSDFLYAMKLAADNSIYAAGVRSIGGNGDFAILHTDANGRGIFCPIGGCAWPSGMVFRDFGSAYAVASAIDIRSDGHVIVAGTVDGEYMGWAHYSPFSANLVAGGIADFPGTDEATAVKFVGADKVVLAGSHLYAGDRNLAVARFQTTTAGAVVDVGDAPWSGTSARLQAALPNPSMHQMTIAFDLPSAQPVSIVLYDASGRAVRTIANEALPAGRHQRTWDGADGNGIPVAAGVYFAQLVAGADRDRRKLVVLR